MNMAHKQGVFEEKMAAYLKVTKKRKGEILDSVVEVTGLTRKGAIKRFKKMQMRDPAREERYFDPLILDAFEECAVFCRPLSTARGRRRCGTGTTG